MRKLPDLSVYLVLDPELSSSFGLVETAVAAARAGVKIVQLRAKSASTEERIEIGRALKLALPDDVALVMNDDPQAAISIGADGLHVGQSDAGAAKARAMIGPNMILGVSCSTVLNAKSIDPTVTDYIGAGPVFGTRTKADHNSIIGFDGLDRIVAMSPVPAVAIGGLKATHCESIRNSLAVGMAVVSAICGQDDPEAAAQNLVEELRQ